MEQPTQGHTWITEKPGFEPKNLIIEPPAYILALFLRKAGQGWGVRGEKEQIMFTATIYTAKLGTD